MFLSCKKDVSEEIPELIGHWQTVPGPDFYFTIDSDNNGDYHEERTYGGGSGSFDGKAKVSDEKLKIGAHTFTIIESPHLIDTATSHIFNYDENGIVRKANWKMTLKGPIFYAGDGDYYKADY